MLTMVYSQLLNEIMPVIYKRFTDKTAEEWRQIYKVRLCLLEGWRSLLGDFVYTDAGRVRVSNSWNTS